MKKAKKPTPIQLVQLRLGKLLHCQAGLQFGMSKVLQEIAPGVTTTTSSLALKYILVRMREIEQESHHIYREIEKISGVQSPPWTPGTPETLQ